jgi:hypothetical protein
MNRVKLTDEALFRLSHPKNRAVKSEICKILGWHPNTILNKMRRNAWNGDLTKAIVLDILEERLRMSKDEILKTQEIGEE